MQCDCLLGQYRGAVGTTQTYTSSEPKTGRVLGTGRCRRLQVEDSGQITGRMELLNTEPVRPAEQAKVESAA